MAMSLGRTVSVVISFNFLIGPAFAQGKAVELAPDIQIKPELDLGLDASSLGTVESGNDYTSRPVGNRKKWELDTGYFDFDDRKSGILPPGDTSGDYSGIRLRRPRQN